MDSTTPLPGEDSLTASDTAFEKRLVRLRKIILLTMVWFAFYVLSSDVVTGVLGLGSVEFHFVIDVISLGVAIIVITLFMRGLWQIPRLSFPIMAGMITGVAGQGLGLVRNIGAVREFMDFFPYAPQTYQILASVLSGFGIILYVAGMFLVVVELMIERQRSAIERRRLAGEVQARRSVEEQLRIKEQFQRAIQNAALDPIRVLDASGHAIWCNEAAAAWYDTDHAGAVSAQPTGWRQDIGLPELCRQIYADGMARDFEATFVSGNGDEHEVWVRLNPMRDANGDVQGVLETSHDLTERIRSREKLVESEARMRAQYMSIPVPTYTWQKRGDDFFLVNYNNAALLATKGRIAEWLGINAHQFFSDRPDVVVHLEECFNGREVIVRETPFRLRSTDELRHLVIRYVFVPPDCIMAHTEDVTDMRRAEQDLLASERELDSIIRTIPDIVFRLDTQGRLTFISQSVRRYGYEPEDMLGKNISEFVHPDDWERTSRTLQERRSDQRGAGSIEIRLLAGPGPHRAVLAAVASGPGAPVFLVDTTGRYETAANGEQRFLGTQGIARDITKQKSTEMALRTSEERFRMLVENSREVIMLTRHDAVVVYLSPAARAVLGWKPSDIENTVPDIIYPEDKPRVSALFERAMKGFSETNAEYRIVTKNGLVKWISHSWSPIFKNGAVDLVVSVLADVTERKNAEEERSRLVTAIEQAAEAVVITGTDGIIQYVNPAFQQITGYCSDEALGQTPRILRSGKHEAAFYEELWDTIASGQVWKGRILNKRKDGTFYEEDMTISPVRAGSGAIVNYVAIKRDITKEVSLERQLYQAQKMEALGTLARGIAHDMNNILSVILGHSEVAGDHIPEGSPASANLAGICRAATRASSLVAQILTFSRSEEPRREPVDLKTVVHEGIALLRASFPPTIEILEQSELENAFALGDPTRMHQVVMNLCTNALQEMEDCGGLLTVTLDSVSLQETTPFATGTLEPGEYLRLEVADTGSGIDPEIQDRIFEPFFTTKRPGEGTGLGLPTVHGIVAAANGAVDVISERGHGATFRVYLPRIPRPGKLEAKRPKPAIRGNEHLLLVDDHADVADITAGVLRSLGYSVDVFTDPRVAWESFQKEPYRYDLIITDNAMPTMDGVQLAVKLRAIRSDLPIILVTGFAQNLQMESIRALGISETVLKPLHRHVLSRAIRRVLDQAEP